jgi:PAS domain S-box-containing protein
MGNIVLQKELFEKLFDSAPDPILIVDNKGVIALANAEAEHKFGYTLAALIGQPVENLLPERFRDSHRFSRSSYTDTPKTRPMGPGAELLALRHDGTEFPVEISLSPLKIEDKLFVISIVRDITDRKEVQKALKEKTKELEHTNDELLRSNSELEQFAYIASHDLQEPLRSIAGSCQLLQRRFGQSLDPAAQEFIDYAVEGAKRMQRLINDLLSYSQVTTKARDPIRTDCNNVLRQIIGNLRESIEATKATIEYDSLPAVLADSSQVAQLFQNIVANALKFHGTDVPHIIIKASKEKSFWHFSVNDNGIGISPQYFDRIFIIFKRLHGQEEYPGTGIGLATCKKIVERHGGRIWVESQPGNGTTFHFTLPATKE